MRHAVVYALCAVFFILYTKLAYADVVQPINAQCSVTIDSIATVQTPSLKVLPQHGWKEVKLPTNWAEYWKDYNGGVWYKIRWQWVCQDTPVLIEPIAFSVDYINSAGAVYLNGQLIWRNQNLVEPLSRSWNVPHYWVLPTAGLNQQENEILIYVNGFAFQYPGLGQIAFKNIHASEAEYQQRIWDRRILFQINIILSITFAIICFVIWILRLKEAAFGWFALSSLLWVLFISNVLMTETFPYPSTLIATQANLVYFILFIFSFCIYLMRFIQLQFYRVEVVVACITLLVVIFIFTLPSEFIPIFFPLIFLTYVGLFFISYLYLSYIAFKLRQLDYIFLAICLTGIVIFAVLDISLIMLGTNTDLRPLSAYTSPIITFFVVVILGMRLARNFKEIAALNIALEVKVQQVSEDLSFSLNEKHKLELENVRLQERIHLSHDLHDGLGASLVRSIITVDQSKENIPNQQFVSILKLLRDDLRQIIDSGSSADNKVPVNPVMWAAPVRYRFSQLMDELEIESSWAFPQTWEIMPNALQCLTLIRVLEESLTNVIKHSRAQNVDIVMHYDQHDRLILSIQDNGIGFDTEIVRQQGLSVGIRSMKMRLEYIGAILELSSTQAGTLIQAIILFK